MKKALLIAFLGMNSLGFSQSDTVKYSMLSDDPNYTYWGLGLSYDFSIDRFNFPLVGFGVDGVFMHEKFSASLHSNFNLLERLTDFSFNGHPDHESIYEPEKSRGIGFRASYYFMENTKVEDQSVKLKQRGNVSYVMLVPAKISTRFGADIGFQTGVTYYNFGDAMINGIDNNGAAASLESKDENAAISTMFNQHVLRIGANRTKCSNFEVMTDAYGKKHTKDFTKIYAHVLVGFGQKMDDIFYASQDLFGNDFFTQYDITTNTNFLPAGGAIGYEYYVMNKLGISWIGELGLMPGPNYSIMNNLYLNFKIRIHYGQFI